MSLGIGEEEGDTILSSLVPDRRRLLRERLKFKELLERKKRRNCKS